MHAQILPQLQQSASAFFDTHPPAQGLDRVLRVLGAGRLLGSQRFTWFKQGPRPMHNISFSRPTLAQDFRSIPGFWASFPAGRVSGPVRRINGSRWHSRHTATMNVLVPCQCAGWASKGYRPGFSGSQVAGLEASTICVTCVAAALLTASGAKVQPYFRPSRAQYSSGKSRVVTERSASVMIHSFLSLPRR